MRNLAFATLASLVMAGTVHAQSPGVGFGPGAAGWDGSYADAEWGNPSYAAPYVYAPGNPYGRGYVYEGFSYPIYADQWSGPTHAYGVRYASAGRGRVHVYGGNWRSRRSVGVSNYTPYRFGGQYGD
jgi:hypothetical protein